MEMKNLSYPKYRKEKGLQHSAVPFYSDTRLIQILILQLL